MRCGWLTPTTPYDPPMNLMQLHEPGQTPTPHADEQGMAIGIDLGTTNSVVAIARDGQVESLRGMCGNALIPSVVDYGEEAPVVGTEALAKAGQAGVVSSIKRLMRDAGAALDVAGKMRSPVEVSADILRHLRAHAERALGQAVTQAVITVPAYFDDTARAATKDAAQLAGLQVLRLVNEPTAAALAYGLDSGAEGVYAVYDLGGGTFDISLLRLTQGVFQVLATGGDAQLGGDDFDAAIAQKLGVSIMEARRIKERLSEADEAGGMTRAQHDALLAPLVTRSITACKRAMQDARLTPADIHGVVLVGGSTRVPLVRAEVQKLFGKEPLAGVNPDEVVAHGAALQAEALTQGGGALLLDVIPLSLGLETMGGLTEKLMERNTPIPASVSQEFTTYQDNQTGMQLHIVQGEREMVADNRSLAQFELKGIPPLPAGVARVKVTFTVDADGLLTVAAEETRTGTLQQVHIKPTYGLEPEAMADMLRTAYANAQADITERLLVEARVEAERSIEEIYSAMRADGALLSEAEKTLIARQIAYVQEAIAGEDRERIDVEMQQLSHAAGGFAQRRMDKAIHDRLQGNALDSIEQNLKDKNHA